jgi:hypothetical protein
VPRPSTRAVRRTQRHRHTSSALRTRCRTPLRRQRPFQRWRFFALAFEVVRPFVVGATGRAQRRRTPISRREATTAKPTRATANKAQTF